MYVCVYMYICIHGQADAPPVPTRSRSRGWPSGDVNTWFE